MEAFREQPVANDKKVYPQNQRLCSFDSINYFSGIQKKNLRFSKWRNLDCSRYSRLLGKSTY